MCEFVRSKQFLPIDDDFVTSVSSAGQAKTLSSMVTGYLAAGIGASLQLGLPTSGGIRMPRQIVVPTLLAIVSMVLNMPVQARSPQNINELRERLASLEQTVTRLKDMEKEIQSLKELLAKSAGTSSQNSDTNAPLATEILETRQLVSEIAAQQSEWKESDSISHLSGYASAGYSKSDSTNEFNRVLFAPIFHFQWRDRVLLESEFEVEVGEDGESEFTLEYLAIDLLLHDNLAVGFGKFLSPIGQYLQNLHPAWINKLASTPPGFGHDQAAPLSEIGAFAKGGLELPGTKQVHVNYTVFIGNGPVLELNADGDEIEAIEAEGVTRDPDDRKVYGGRLGIVPFGSSEIGFSFATGDAALPDEDSRRYKVWSADFVTRWRELEWRGEWIRSEIGSVSEAVSSIVDAQAWEAWYTQLSYHIRPTRLEAIVRYGDYNSIHGNQAQEQLALGVNWWFNTHAAAKLTYEFNEGANRETTNEDRLLFEIAYGL
jgi:hypothetical protein